MITIYEIKVIKYLQYCLHYFENLAGVSQRHCCTGAAILALHHSKKPVCITPRNLFSVKTGKGVL